MTTLDKGVTMSGTSGPTVGRLKRPSWRDPRLLVGLVLIAIAVVAVSAIVGAADRTAPYYTATAVLTPGTVLKESDVTVTHVRVGDGVYVSADGEAPWGSVVTRVVGAGELIPAGAVASSAQVNVRAVAVHTTSPLAADVTRGSIVDVWLTTDTADGPVSTPVAQALVVSQIERDSGAFAVGVAETVYVLVPQESMSQFLGDIATEGQISIVGQVAGAAS